MKKDINSSTSKLSIDLGVLGKVKTTHIEEEVLEVFAKQVDSFSMAGPTFSDDCVQNPPLCGPMIT